MTCAIVCRRRTQAATGSRTLVLSTLGSATRDAVARYAGTVASISRYWLFRYQSLTELRSAVCNGGKLVAFGRAAEWIGLPGCAPQELKPRRVRAGSDDVGRRDARWQRRDDW